MKTIFHKTLLLPFLVTVSIAVTIFVMAVVIPHNLYANPDSRKPRAKVDYTIEGREYQENGIVFDIPKEGDPSRDATVVTFPNHAVIPSYVTVDGKRYTVRVLRYGAPQTLYGDTTGWVTLPPTLKRCDLTGSIDSDSPSGYKQFLGVANVNITDLDSFLNMDCFLQDVNNETGYLRPENLRWKLYLNGHELKDHDYVYPEGSSFGTSLARLDGVRSITFPASDTVRKQPHDWYYHHNTWAEYLRFKADSGYDLRYFQIRARHIVFPRNMKEFYGYANVDKKGFCYYTTLKVARWPENLEYLATTNGLDYKTLRIEDLPRTVTKVGGDGYDCQFNVADSLTIPQNLTHIGGINFHGTKWRKITIEDSDRPLHISGKIGCPAMDSLSFYIGRNLVVDNDQSYFLMHYCKNKTATIIIGDKVTEMPDRLPTRLRFDGDGGYTPPVGVTYPKYLYCMGLTPPNFKTALPEILDWKFETVLVVPEAAEQAYRNHPVWKYFYIILTHGVDEINTDKEVAKETWYSLDGKLLGKPEPGKINIRVTTYTDGTTRSHKVAVPQE